jgi:hypothetical protein
MSDFVDLSNFDPDNIPEGEIYEDGHELHARITRLAKGTDKNGNDYLMPWFEDPDNVNLEDFSDYIPLPTSNDTEKEKGRKLRTLKAFAESFGLGLFEGEFDLEEAKGATGWMILGIGKSKEGKPTNRPKKYILNT